MQQRQPILDGDLDGLNTVPDGTFPDKTDFSVDAAQPDAGSDGTAPLVGTNVAPLETIPVGVPPSNDPAINSLLTEQRWGGAITYAFPTSSAQYPANYPSGVDFNPLFGVTQLNSGQMQAAHFALSEDLGPAASISGGFSVEGFTLLDITFVAPTPAADIKIANSLDPQTAYAFFPQSSPAAGDAFFGPDARDARVGTYGWVTMLHELGHSLGLDHPHEVSTGVGRVLEPAIDSVQMTVMSYRSVPGTPIGGGYTIERESYPQTYMPLDILTLQYLYGADYTSNAGNNFYAWGPGSGDTFINGKRAIDAVGNKVFMSLWDGGGRDTYDLRNFDTAVTVDLRPGGVTILSDAQRPILDQSSMRLADGNVYNSFLFDNDPRSLIENGFGGGGNDRILGNIANNLLNGFDGNDTLVGANGSDTLIGRLGNDDLRGNDQNDLLYGLQGNDRVNGGNGKDSLQGGLGSDVLSGGLNNDVLWGEQSGFGINGDFNLGGGAFDRISGDGGNDTIYGQNGNDILNGNDGNDFIIGGFGADVINGGDGNDELRGSAGNDTITGGAGLDRIIGGDGKDTFVLFRGSGADVVEWYDGDFLDFTNMGVTRADVFNSISQVGRFLKFDFGFDEMWLAGVTRSDVAGTDILA